MTDHDRGQVDTSAAEVYDDVFVPALFGRFADPVSRLVDVGTLDSVVDVACGTGSLTRVLRIRTGGRVVGVDINPAMLAVAQRRTSGIEFREANALALPFADGEFDVATCMFGLMFFPDPTRGVAEMARVADRGIVAVWDSIDRSAGYSAMQELFRDELGDDAAASLDAPFGMGTPGLLEEILTDAGIADATFTRVEGTGLFDSIEQWVTTEVRGWTLGERVTDVELANLVAAAQDRLGDFVTGDGCTFGMTARVARWGRSELERPWSGDTDAVATY